jgi:hypothetical protein
MDMCSERCAGPLLWDAVLFGGRRRHRSSGSVKDQSGAVLPGRKSPRLKLKRASFAKLLRTNPVPTFCPILRSVVSRGCLIAGFQDFRANRDRAPGEQHSRDQCNCWR